MGFPRQEYWSGLPFPSPGDLLTQGSNLHLLYWQEDSLSLNHLGSSSFFFQIQDFSCLLIKYIIIMILGKKTVKSSTFKLMQVRPPKRQSKDNIKVIVQQINKYLFIFSVSLSVVSESLGPHGLQPTRLFCPWNSPGKNTGAGCHFLLQGIFPTQRSNLGLPHCGQTLYQPSHLTVFK